MSITKPISMMDRLRKQQRIDKVIDPKANTKSLDGSEAFAIRKDELSSAIDLISPLMPNAPFRLQLSVAGTVTTVLRRAVNVGTCYTPFHSTPEGAISFPRHMTDTLRELGARMPETSEGDESYRPRYEVTLSAMAELSQLSKSTLASVNAGRQHLTVEGLNLWRIALVKIGKANQNIAEVAALTTFEDPEEFLDQLVRDWESLDSPLPIERIIEWGVTYTKLSEDAITARVEIARPNIVDYTKAVIKVWRDEYRESKLPNLSTCRTLLDVFKTKTSGRRLGRGFNEMTKAVHPDGTMFNTRIKYSKTNFAAYKARYDSDHTETGISSEVLMGYCFFLGINPIAMLQWVAAKEAKLPGTWDVERVHDENSFLLWRGAISPRECLRFYEAIQQMGLVSDQNLWSLNLLHPSVTYKNLPTEEEVMNRLSGDMLLEELVSQYIYSSPAKPEDAVREWKEYKGTHNTLYGLAEDLRVLRGEPAITLATYGMAAFRMGKGKAEEELAKLEAIVDEKEFIKHGLSKLVTKSSEDSYAELVKDTDGNINHDKSYQNEANNSLTILTINFYRKVVELAL
ncbi:hypothetical protein VPHK437A_0019 [Vibrio phage K437a]